MPKRIHSEINKKHNENSQSYYDSGRGVTTEQFDTMYEYFYDFPYFDEKVNEEYKREKGTACKQHCLNMITLEREEQFLIEELDVNRENRAEEFRMINYHCEDFKEEVNEIVEHETRIIHKDMHDMRENECKRVIKKLTAIHKKYSAMQDNNEKKKKEEEEFVDARCGHGTLNRTGF